MDIISIVVLILWIISVGIAILETDQNTDEEDEKLI